MPFYYLNEYPRFCSFLLLTLFIALLLKPSVSFSGETRVIRGERPPIDLAEVPDDAWEAGIIRIQFSDQHTRWLDDHNITYNKEGIVQFGISAVDSLNMLFGADGFHAIFDSPALDSRYSDRHRQWGFHLWYDLRVPDTVHIIEMVKAYQKVSDIRVAEPHYVKELHGEILSPDVSAKGKDDVMMPDDPFFHNQWHYHNTGQAGGTPGADISLPEAWNITTGENEVIVAVIDGGILTTHPDLEESMWEDIGYNFAMNTETIQPNHHGTHVGGTIAARSNNGLGVSGIAGGWGDITGAKLMSLQVFSSQGNGGFELAPVFGADNGAAISQNSWGYQTPNVYEQIYLDAIDYFNLHGGGEVMLGGITTTSAGNSGENDAYYPGYYSGAMAIASTNNKDQKAGYSNYGSFIEISAPGGETSPQTAGGVYSTTIANSYSFGQGTSMACPHVSGVLALMLSVAPGEFANYEIRDMIRESADSHYGVNPGYFGLLGSGRLNAYEALLLTLQNMSGVSEFNAWTENNYRTNLSWIPNTEEEPVMLVWHTDEETGEPDWGLQPGDTIPGGGKVLFKGFGQAFSHVMPDHAPQHYYTIWSYDEAEEDFSRSNSVQVTREGEQALLPFEETFNYPWWPPGWNPVLVSGGDDNTGVMPALTLTDLADDPQLDPAAGEYAVRFNASEAHHGSAYRLVSKPVTSAGINQVSLAVDWHIRDETPGHDGRLALQVSLDAISWTTLAEFAGKGARQGWQTAEMNIPNHFANRDTLYVGFLFQTAENNADMHGDMFIDHLRMQPGTDELVVDFVASATEVEAGRRVLITSKTAGHGIEKKKWSFGEDAAPGEAYGKGPHEVVYREPGDKTISLAVNDSIEVIKEDFIRVLPSSYPPPRHLEAHISGGADIQLTWEWSSDDHKAYPQPLVPGRDRDTLHPDGFNIYRNGDFYDNLTDPDALSYIDKDVPEGWLTYMVKAYFDHPHEESPPTGAVTLAINETEVTIHVDGEGTTIPEPGVHPALENDTLRVEAIAAENHGFLHWLVEGEDPIEDNPAHLYITGPANIVAVFQDETSVSYLSSNEDFVVYPNPSGGIFTVSSSLQIERLEVLDLSGQRLRLLHPESGETLINLHDLARGVYLLKISTKAGTATEKLLIR